MKSKKKLLLLGVGAMGALALGVGATSTFAWYQATSKGGKVNGDLYNTDSLTVADPGYSADAAGLPLKVILVKQTTATNLELSHYYTKTEMDGKPRAEGGTWEADSGHTYNGSSELLQSANDGFYKAYYKTTSPSSLVFSDQTKSADYSLYFDYKVGVYVDFPDSADAGDKAAQVGVRGGYIDVSGDIKWQDINGNIWDEDEVRVGLVGKKVTYALTYVDDARTLFFGATLTPSVELVKGTGNNTVTALATGFTLEGTGTPTKISNDSNSPEFIGRFGMYVEGSKGGDDALEDYDTLTINADFKVTISAAA